ncbi:MAG: alpha/beta fold hydrolase [Phycisphaerales bacterium]|nr:alpha/beta fold hydrolase [Phycisphaerales bacterium]
MPRFEHILPVATLLIVGSLSNASAQVASTPIPDPGPAERAGREIDDAVVKLKHWLTKRSDQANAAAKTASTDAQKWFDARVVELLGKPDAPRVHGVFVARAIDPATGVAPLPATDAKIVPQWINLDALSAAKLPARVVVLVHGLDEPGAVWDDLAPALLDKKHHVAKFDYPNDGPIVDASILLTQTLTRLKSQGVQRVDIVAHSMGGLVARDALTRSDAYAGDAAGSASLPAVDRLILLATPNQGSKLTALQPVSEAREQLARAIDGTQASGSGLVNSYADGAGEAARDLSTGSAFLTALNARTAPKNVRITNVIARVIPEDRVDGFAADVAKLAALVDERPSPSLDRALKSLVSSVGDGIVSTDSMRLDSAESIVVTADHRSVVRKWHVLEGLGVLDASTHDLPPGVKIVLDKLAPESAPNKPAP